MTGKTGSLLTLLFLSGLAKPALASQDVSESLVSKTDIKHIKIFSNREDRINFYLTGNNKVKYRIPNLTQTDAEKILAHFKNNDSLLLRTTPNKRGYQDVLNWYKK